VVGLVFVCLNSILTALEAVIRQSGSLKHETPNNITSKKRRIRAIT